MKWYDVIRCDNTVKNPLVCDLSNINDYGLTEYDFTEGKIIDNWSKDILIKASDKKHDGFPDDVLQTILMIPIFSKRLTDALNNADIKGIQYLEIKVLNSDNSQSDCFYIANILNHITALDLENSDYSIYDEKFPDPEKRGKISRIRKYVLKKDKLADLNIVRLKEYEQAFFVSAKVKKIFDKNKFTGLSFREVNVV